MEENNKPSKSKIVQTYAQDMAQVLEDGKEGLIKKIIHGEEESEAERKNLSPESKKNKFFMLIGILLVLVALITLFFLFLKKNVATVPVELQFMPIIFNDKSISIEVADLKKDAIEAKVLNEVNTTTVKGGGVEGIYLTFNQASVGLRKFIEIINGTFVPGNTLLVDDNFLMGVVNEKDDPSSTAGKDFFILLKMRSVPDIFDALHTWEPKMFSDLHGFFGVDITPDTKYLFTKNFEDGIVQNKNARILYDKDNKIVMMYVFADDNSIIITNTENATYEIMLRLASSQVKK